MHDTLGITRGKVLLVFTLPPPTHSRRTHATPRASLRFSTCTCLQLKDANGEKIKVTPAEAKKLFEAADTSKDGYVNFNEFVCLMAVMQKGNAEKKLDLAFRLYDSDRSGMLEGGESASAGFRSRGASLSDARLC